MLNFLREEIYPINPLQNAMEHNNNAAQIEAAAHYHESIFLIGHWLQIEPLLVRANQELRALLQDHWHIEAFFTLAAATFEPAFRAAAHDALVDAAVQHMHEVARHEQFKTVLTTEIGFSLVQKHLEHTRIEQIKNLYEVGDTCPKCKNILHFKVVVPTTVGVLGPGQARPCPRCRRLLEYSAVVTRL